MYYYGGLWATTTARLQVFIGLPFYYAQLWPPTYEPPTGHPYKCPHGQR
jgi:hypothetical protein